MIRARAFRSARRAYTLIELLIVVTIVGSAAAIAVPTLSSAGSLRVQGAIRTVVSEISVAQSDAIAFQQGRGILFTCPADADGKCNPSMLIAEVNGSTFDAEFGTIAEHKFGGAQYGFAAFDTINLTNGLLVFDELGGPVNGPGSDEPAPSGSIEMTGSGQRFRIDIEAYTGRVTVQKLY